MSNTRAYASLLAGAPLVSYSFDRRVPGPRDVVIDIRYCGICHSDIHQVRDEWGGATFPMVPGHEIVGVVSAVGKKVKRFRVGDHAGVGCLVDSCRKCKNCKDGDEQFCEKGAAYTYNGTEMDRKTPTQGGYSNRIVIDEAFVLKVSKKLPLERVAPLLCAGITTYSPLKRFGVKNGQHVGVVGLGGLGHMAVKIAAAMGARVTVFSTSPEKSADAKKLGARQFVVSRDSQQMQAQAGSLDLIIDTVSAPHDLNAFLGLLKKDGTMVIVGVPTEPAAVEAFSLIGGRHRLAGSLIGGIQETQEMLNFCAKKGILSDVEVISAAQINEAYDRTVRGDVKFRFVVDTSTI